MVGKTSKQACTELESMRNLTLDTFDGIFHPDDVIPLYQRGLKIRKYNLDVKKQARNKGWERIEKIKEYCKHEMPKNRFLRLANEHIENTNKFFYFDFYYSFLYCQTQKVIKNNND